MDLTIAVLTYKGEHLLSDCIQSILHPLFLLHSKELAFYLL